MTPVINVAMTEKGWEGVLFALSLYDSIESGVIQAIIQQRIEESKEVANV